jgi:hypothetical protein
MADETAPLSEVEERIFADLMEGEAGSLAAYLQAGNAPSPALCLELADMIDAGEIAVKIQERTEAESNRSARERRDLEIGAWVWVRRIHVRGATIESIEQEALELGGLNFSRATIHRAYLKFKKRMEGADDFARQEGHWALHRALRQLCEGADLDFYEQFLRLYSVQNLDLEIAPRK